MTTGPVRDPQAEIEELRLRLEEAEQTLAAIRSGEVDSIVVEGPDGPRVYALEGGVNSYRTLIEAMSEGAATLTEAGAILYCNRRFAEMVGAPLPRVMGGSILDHVAPRDRPALEALLRRGADGESKGELALRTVAGLELPAHLSICALHDRGERLLCLIATDLSEQKRSEEMVALERLARSVLEQAAEAIVVCDRRGQIIRANAASQQLCGTNPLLLPFREAFPVELPATSEGPDRPEGPGDVPAAALAGATLRAVHAVLQRPGGSRVDVLVSAGPLRGAEVQPIGCVVTLVDVTGMRRAEEALREREERLAVTLRSIGDAVVATDAAGRVTLLNPVAEALTGWSAAEAAGRPLAEVFRILNEDTRQPVPSPVERVLREGFIVGLANHTALLARDGSERPIADSAAPIRDPGGRITGVVLVFRDRTEEREHERALRRSREEYRQLVEGSGSVILRADRDMRITYMNPYGLRLFGYALEEIIGKRALGTIIPATDEQGRDIAAMAEDLMRHPEKYPVNVHQNARKDGSLVWMSWTNQPTYDERGELVELLVVGNDISKLKQAEEVVRRSEEALRESDRRKDEFLATLSHELRNPLAPIRNSIELLQHAPPDAARATRALEVIERQTRHITRLVDDLLDVTRISRGRIELRRSRVDLRELARQTADDLRATIEERGVSFRVALPEAEAWADVDATRVAQIIGNLLHNSSKFTRPGDEIVLSLTATGAQARISVRDTGTGIDAALLPTLFRPFVQGERTLARSSGGLGLGLALAKGIAELHGGTVRAESAGVGKGAELVITLPLAPSVPAEASERLPARGTTRPRRVLVVDDNRDAARSMADLVEMLGHSAEVAFDGPSAIEKTRAQHPDVVLCDLGLPGMSGYEVARALRACAERVRLFALSGYAQAEDVKRAVEAGFDGHIAKPATAEEIEELLGSDGGGASRRAPRE